MTVADTFIRTDERIDLPYWARPRTLEMRAKLFGHRSRRQIVPPFRF